MPTRSFNCLMNKNKPSIFVREMARTLFTSEVLVNSTITGKSSNRSKSTLPKPFQLDPTMLSVLRGKII